jgi:hypothetical protein
MRSHHAHQHGIILKFVVPHDPAMPYLRLVLMVRQPGNHADYSFAPFGRSDGIPRSPQPLPLPPFKLQALWRTFAFTCRKT